jgi:hypothetical protein
VREPAKQDFSDFYLSYCVLFFYLNKEEIENRSVWHCNFDTRIGDDKTSIHFTVIQYNIHFVLARGNLETEISLIIRWSTSETHTWELNSLHTYEKCEQTTTTRSEVDLLPLNLFVILYHSDCSGSVDNHIGGWLGNVNSATHSIAGKSKT